ncbi:MAG: fumarylacetoacetate hydrolase family protein [Myxococcota bacterium]|nr:fumarylacetoacetate hydrolase family protein [Myxococcota bacterium]
MKLFTTDRGIAREAADGALEILEVEATDLGAQLAVDQDLEAARSANVRERVARDDVRLLAPVPAPRKVIGIGINYQSHVEETREMLERLGVQLPADPVFFLAPGSAVIGPEDPIVLPRVAPDMVDYEIELAAVIGRGGFEIDEDTALTHVAGYTLANDVSARDVQRTAMSGPEFELSHAKGMDGFKPMGPALVTVDEFPEPLDVHLETRVNGELRQDARTDELVHPVARCIARITQFMRLDPGDVILTGSPAGVGVFRGTFLKPGDRVELSAAPIGTLRNPVVAAG